MGDRERPMSFTLAAATLKMIRAIVCAARRTDADLHRKETPG